MSITPLPSLTAIVDTDFLFTGPAKLSANFEALNVAATELKPGLAQIATYAEVYAGTETAKHVTPKTLQQYAYVLSADILADVISPALGTLTDVTLTSPANGEYLKYDGSKWVNTATTAAAHTLQSATHSNVSITNPLLVGHGLVYDGTNFVNRSVGGTYASDFDYILIKGTTNNMVSAVVSATTEAGTSMSSIFYTQKSNGVLTSKLVTDYTNIFPITIPSNINKTEINIYSCVDNSVSSVPSGTVTNIIIDWELSAIVGEYTTNYGGGFASQNGGYVSGTFNQRVPFVNINGSNTIVNDSFIYVRAPRDIMAIGLGKTLTATNFQILLKNYKSVEIAPDFETVYIKGTYASHGTRGYISSTDSYYSPLGEAGKIYKTGLSTRTSQWSDILPLSIPAGTTKTTINGYAMLNETGGQGYEDDQITDITIDWLNSTVDGVMIWNSGSGTDDYSNQIAAVLSGKTNSTISAIFINTSIPTSTYSINMQTTVNSIVTLPCSWANRNVEFTIKHYKTTWASTQVTNVTNVTNNNYSTVINAIDSSTLASNGYIKMSNGFIIQWGVTPSALESGTVTFPIVFPNQCFTVNFTNKADNISQLGVGREHDIVTDGVANITKSSFYYRTNRWGTWAYFNATKIYWIAMGY